MRLDAKNIIGMAIGIYVLTATVPGAISTIYSTNTSGWDPATATLFSLLGLATVAYFVYRIVAD